MALKQRSGTAVRPQECHKPHCLYGCGNNYVTGELQLSGERIEMRSCGAHTDMLKFRSLNARAELNQKMFWTWAGIIVTTFRKVGYRRANR